MEDLPTGYWGELYSSRSSNRKKSTTNKIIVLDIDENLVHTFTNLKCYSDMNLEGDPQLEDLRKRIYMLEFEGVSGVKGDGSRGMLWGIERPHLSAFLLFCFCYFEMVCVWSAGEHNYVHAVKRKIFASTGRNPHFVFTRNECEEGSVGMTKPLRKLATKIANEQGGDPEEILSRMYMMDDKHYTFDETNPENGILTPAYLPDPPSIRRLRDQDDALLRLREWFLFPEVINCQRVDSLVKNTIFDYSLQDMKRARKEKDQSTRKDRKKEPSTGKIKVETFPTSRIKSQVY